MITLQYKGNEVKLNNPNEFGVYLDLSDRLGHNMAQTIVSSGVDPSIIDYDFIFFDITEENLLLVDKIIDKIHTCSFWEILPVVAASLTTIDEDQVILLQNAGETIDKLYMRDLSLDFDSMKKSLTSAVSKDTLLHFYTVDLEEFSVSIETLSKFKFAW